MRGNHDKPNQEIGPRHRHCQQRRENPTLTHLGLSHLVVMMWEREINTAGVDIHIVSEDR